MKRYFKSLLTLVLSIALVGSSFIKVDAYTQDYNFAEKDITINYIEEGKGNNIALTGTLKDDSAEVSIQEIAVSKEVYDNYSAIGKEMFKFEADRQAETTELANTRIAKYQALKSTTQGTEEYNTALAEYDQANNAYNEYTNVTASEMKKYREQQGKVVPDPNSDPEAWTKLQLSERTDDANLYEVKPKNENAYYFVWVQVKVGGETYYKFDIDCLPQTVESPKCRIEDGKYYNKNGEEVSETEYNKACNPSCKIVDDKYYDNNGKEVTKDEYEKACGNPQTGNNVYYTYGIVTIIAAFGLYIATRKVKKLSK